MLVPTKCSHGVPLSEKFCRECSLLLAREALAWAERDVLRWRAEIVKLEGGTNQQSQESK